MSPEEFYKINKMRLNKEVLFEMRVKSLDWMLGCYHKGTIRRRTIINLIPLANLYEVLQFMEEKERYEDCSIVKRVIDEIYEQIESKNKKNDMSKKRQKEIIGLLENTIEVEKSKIGGGNSELIERLTAKLEKVKEWKPKPKK
tara:strand:+ start:2506 stop:2934 length:429 start_codon:yes stop_codon:yes gene_type:complete